MVVMDTHIYDFSAAAREGNLDILRQCSKRDSNKRDADGMTPVHWAALYGNLEAMKVLVVGGGDPDKPNNEGSSAVHLAATNGQLHCLIFLTNYGGNVHAINDVGDTPMHEASNKGRLECVRHLEAIVTHQVSQDRQKVEKMQQRAKRDAEKRVKQKTKYLKKLDRDFEKKSAKQRKYLGGTPMATSNANFYGSMNGMNGDEMTNSSQKLTFSQLAGMPQSNNELNHEFNDEDDLDDDSMSGDSFRRAEEEFLARTSLLTDDIVFERTDKQASVTTEHTDLSMGSSSSEFPTKSAAMMASLNSLHSKGHNGRMNGRSPYDKMKYNGATNNVPVLNGKMHNGDGRRISVDTTRSNNYNNNQRSGKGSKPFGTGQLLGGNKPGMPAINVPPSKRTGRPVGFVEVHMGPLYTFLHSLELDEFREIFLREKIDLGACLLCDENDLREIGLPLGPRKKLLDGIRKRNNIIANSNKNDFKDSAV